LIVLLAGCTTTSDRELIAFSATGSSPKEFTGTLTLPVQWSGPVPAVVLVHGSAGVDDRYDFHRPALLEAGIATLEVDFKSGVFTGFSDRPPLVSFRPFAFGALDKLGRNPRVDPNRIAIMGFSLGGHLSIITAAADAADQSGYQGGRRFAAHLGLYPACNWLREKFPNARVTGAPMLILTASEDSWGDAEACPRFADWLNAEHPGLVQLKIYAGAHHGFDRAGSWQGHAPLAISQPAILRWDQQAAEDARVRAIAFLLETFGL
jgi:dienelactone hydrolase